MISARMVRGSLVSWLSDQARKNDSTYAPLGKQLSDFFKSRVKLKCSEKGNGQITIPFKNEADLIRIMQLLDGLKK